MHFKCLNSSDTGTMPSIYKTGWSQQSVSCKNWITGYHCLTVCKTSYGCLFYIRPLLMDVYSLESSYKNAQESRVEQGCSRISLFKNLRENGIPRIQFLRYGIPATGLPKVLFFFLIIRISSTILAYSLPASQTM
jgi:hypothetical protein